MASQLTYGELQDAARIVDGVDPSLEYEELREELDVKECRQCGDEFVHGWSEKFCTDGCEVEYIHEHDL